MTTKTVSKKKSEAALIRQLEAQVRHIKATIAELEQAIKEPGTTQGESADEAAEAQEQAKQFAVVQQLQRQLAQVLAARQRLTDGTYGTCESCGRPIPQERLEALPYTTLCVDCQRRREHAPGS